jgi:site-specific recombinase XerD
VDAAQALIGHADIGTTAVYSRRAINQQIAEKIIKKVENFQRPKKAPRVKKNDVLLKTE